MITIDFETRSAAALRGQSSVGSWNYSTDPTTEPLCLAWAINRDPVKLWAPDRLARIANYRVDDINELFDAIEIGHLVEAHNVAFERHIWLNVMTKRYGFPEIRFDSWRCSMAKAAACGLPQSLEKLAEALNLPVRKDKAGNAAMKRLTEPETGNYRFNGKYQKVKSRYPAPAASDLFDKHNGRGFSFSEKPEDLRLTFDYCKTDVETERTASDRLPSLSVNELAVWQLDQKINDRGVKIDFELCQRATDSMDVLKAEAGKDLDRVTNGRVTGPDQVDRIISYLNSHGVVCDSIAKDKVEELLSQRLPNDCRRVLEIRQSVAASSLKKYPKMVLLSDDDDIMRNNLQYHGAFTGRWAGRGAQVQNFPRVTPPDIELLADTIKGGDVDELKMLFGDAIQATKQCLRGAIIARPGRKLLVWDYGQIEARVLSWLADDDTGLEIFASGRCPYKSAAVEIYEKPYERISGEQRQVGKWSILGLGYGMGAKRYRAQLAMGGLHYSDGFCQRVVKAYRKKFKKIVRFWRRLNEAALFTVRNGRPVKIGRMRFDYKTPFLTCQLPNGRKIYYFEPFIAKESRSVYVGHGFETREVDQLCYKRTEHKRLVTTRTYGGKLAENITQGVARDFMADGMLRLEAAGFDILATIHDEVIAEVDEDDSTRTLDSGVELLTQLERWGDGCPLIADGFETKRYRKG